MRNRLWNLIFGIGIAALAISSQFELFFSYWPVVAWFTMSALIVLWGSVALYSLNRCE